MTIIHFLVSVLAIVVAANLVPGISVTLVSAIILAIVLGIINVFIKPFIFLLTLPLNILTLGLFSLVLNALFVMLASAIVPDFSVRGFWPAFFFSIVVSLVTMLFGLGFKKA